MSADNLQSDGPLVAAALAGDRSALEDLAGKYRRALLRTAWSRLGQTEAAEDAVQETLLCVFKSLHTYDSRFSFRTWLWTILLNQCRRQAKQLARASRTADSHAAVESFAEISSSAPLPAESLLAAERNDQLRQLLARLPEAQADALRLRFFGEMKFEEISASLQCTLSTAKYRVRAGLQQLSLWIAGHDEPACPSTESIDPNLPARPRSKS